jgi:outer membrane protein TolC
MAAAGEARTGRRYSAGACLVLLLAGAARATETPLASAPLPSPLTLEQALSLADDAHPDLDRAQARLTAANAGLDQAESTSGLRANIDLTPQWVLPSLRIDDELVNDSRARFLISKRLYDFGRTASLSEAARSEIVARELKLLDTRQSRRIDILARFLDVLLSDLRYAVDNEAMAHHYVNFDKSRERRRLGQISDVDLLELEQRYQEAFILRTRSQKRQAQTRMQLAITLNRPDELPADLVLPRFPGNDREVPDIKALFTNALQKNPALVAQRQETESARAQVAAERARRYPVLSAEGEAAYYERNFVSRDDLRATLNLRVPLWQGGEDRAARARARAHQHEHEARLRRTELDLRQTVLDLVQDLESLKIERNAAKVRTSYRDLYLDRSRALYELEVKSDLGDAMTRVTEAQWLAAQVEFRLAMVWARLDALTGDLIQTSSQEPAR